MTTKNGHRPLPHEKDIPLKYQDSNEPLSGTASNVAKAPKKQQLGYQNDVTLDWEAICGVLAKEGYRLNHDGTLEYITNPDLPKGLDMVQGQLLRRNKAYASILGRRNLIGVLSDEDGLSEYQRKVAKCLWHPSAHPSELKALGAYVKSWQLPDQEMSDRNWRGEGGISAYGYIPRKMIPRRDQFKESLHNLEFGDIFTLFKGAALEQLKLFIGRVVLGHSGTIDPSTKERLRHTYRNILVVEGKHAGQGKSDLFRLLNSTLERVGFNVNQSCPALNSRFNLNDPFTSDMIFKDDTNNEELPNELSSSNAKILATNGWIATEQKGENAVATKCTAAVMYLSNRIEQRLFWKMDDGMRSRITVCSTELEGSVPEDLLPRNNLPALAAKHKVDEETLMLWACRLAADEFAKYINSNSYLLEARVKELADAANNSSNDPLDGTIAALVMGYMLEKGEAPPKNLNKGVLAIALKGMLNVKQSPEVAKLLGDATKIPAWSPAQGLKWINPESILTAHHTLMSGGVATSPNDLFKKTFESLSLKDGNKCYGSPSVVLPRWTEVVANNFTLNRIKELCDIMAVEYAPNRGRMASDVRFDLDYFFNS